MIFHDAIATRVEIYDATERELDLVHFSGCGTLTMRLRHTREKEVRIDRRVAKELVLCFDHFARHEQLPLSFPQPEYHI